ncbi:MAG: hypothetical protein IJ874_03755 [Ruminococcus sp.]|nr:hypothetical protein [Ruminococcus sp.]
MFWTILLSLVLAAVVLWIFWTRSIRYEPGRYIFLKHGNTPPYKIKLPDKGSVSRQTGGRTCTFYRSENNTVCISYGDSNGELHWHGSYRFNDNDKNPIRFLGSARKASIPYRTYIIAFGIAAALILAGGVFGYRLHKVGELLDRTQYSEPGHSGSPEVIKDKDIKGKSNDYVTNILITVTGSYGEPGMMKIASFDRQNRSMKLISLLGDTLVDYNGTSCRLREVPVSSLTETIEGFFYIHIDDIIMLDEGTAAQLADINGGSDLAMTYDDIQLTNASLTQKYGAGCTLIDPADYFPEGAPAPQQPDAEPEEKLVHLTGQQAVAFASAYSRSDAVISPEKCAAKQTEVMSTVISDAGIFGLLFKTDNYTSAAEGVTTSLTKSKLWRLGFRTLSFWRNYAYSYTLYNDICLPAEYGTLTDSDGNVSLYTAPGSLRQSVYRIIYYDMKG